MQDLQDHSTRSNQTLVIAVTLSCLLLVGSAVLVQRISRQADDTDGWIAHTIEVKQAITQLVLSLTSAESGLRGYIITRDRGFLEPWAAARDSVPIQMNRLEVLAADNHKQAERIVAAKAVVDARLQTMADAVTLAENTKTEDIVRIMGRRGSQLMDDIHRRMDELDRDESALLEERRNHAATLRTQFVVAVAIMLLACGVLACVALFAVRRYVAALDQNRSKLALYNTELEARVNERTVELVQATEVATRERGRAEALLTDVNHRVGNNLALVSSFLTMQQRAVKSPEASRALSAARARVQAIASAHRKLRLGSDFATVKANEVLGAVLEDIVAGLPPGDLIRINFQVAPLEIHARDAVSLGVLTSELVMNAVKHAFSVGDSGEVSVIFSNGADNAPFLEVIDDGRGWHEQQVQETGGLGSRIIDMVARQFGGKAQRSRRREDDHRPGTRVRIELARLQLMHQT